MEKNPLKSELFLPHSLKGVCLCMSDFTPRLQTILSQMTSGRILGMQDDMTMGEKGEAEGGSPSFTYEPSVCHLIGRCVW